jgi:predicted phosphohydrolase
MDIFGPQWHNHPERIRNACERLIEPQDLLLIPGDLSWALKRKQAEVDLAFLASLPGIKVVSKGNHDYWWDSDKRLNYDGLSDTPFVSADNEVGVAATRGWDEPNPNMTREEAAQAQKILTREFGRLAKKLDAIKDANVKIAMIHYPPSELFLPLLKQYSVAIILYGHLHLGGGSHVLPESWNGMQCYCVAADRVQFTPRLISLSGASLEH